MTKLWIEAIIKISRCWLHLKAGNHGCKNRMKARKSFKNAFITFRLLHSFHSFSQFYLQIIFEEQLESPSRESDNFQRVEIILYLSPSNAFSSFTLKKKNWEIFRKKSPFQSQKIRGYSIVRSFITRPHRTPNRQSMEIFCRRRWSVIGPSGKLLARQPYRLNTVRTHLLFRHLLHFGLILQPCYNCYLLIYLGKYALVISWVPFVCFKTCMVIPDVEMFN